MTSKYDKLKAQEYYINNKKKISEQRKIYYEANKKKIHQYHKEYMLKRNNQNFGCKIEVFKGSINFD